MRIIAGTRRGMGLSQFEGDWVRPTLDKVKQAVFNMLVFDIAQANVLDVFGGCGNLSIEALSRGASKATIIDKDKNSIAIIKKNIEKAKFQDDSCVINDDFMNMNSFLHEKFDIVFLDPPYGKCYLEPAINLLLKHDLLSENAKIICENDMSEAEVLPNDKLLVKKQKSYGRVRITVLEKLSL